MEKEYQEESRRVSIQIIFSEGYCHNKAHPTAIVNQPLVIDAVTRELATGTP